MLRDIVLIDEAKCDGCGLCITACHEGAIQLIQGKARVVAEVLCDGLGACIGHCPRGAITIEKREAPAFDEAAVATHLQRLGRPPAEHTHGTPAHQVAGHATGSSCENPFSHAPVRQPDSHATGCPGSRFETFSRPAAACQSTETDARDAPSELGHWPVQLRLLSPMAPVLRGARLLLAADCVPVAYADFHRRLLKGRAVVIACPKLDDTSSYIDKLAEIIRVNQLTDMTVVHMEVPCCTGIQMMAIEARRRAGVDVPLHDITMSRHGEILAQKQIPLDTAA